MARAAVWGSRDLRALPVDEMLQRLCEKIRRDAEVLDCVKEVEHCLRIVKIGTSADIQLDIFNKNQHHGVDAALHASTRWIVLRQALLRPITKGSLAPAGCDVV